MDSNGRKLQQGKTYVFNLAILLYRFLKTEKLKEEVILIYGHHIV